jgi:iron complex outermembrane recepter protein
MQVRTIGYNFLGFNSQLKNVQQRASLIFFNPKAGLTYALTNQSSLYASFSIGNKEPNRDDYTQSSPESRPNAEHLRDLEAGYRLQSTRFSVSANYFLMDYKNQLVLTGKINDVGSYTRTNIPRSYRTGIELEGAIRLAKTMRWNANATFSANKVRNFREFVDDYDNGGQQENTYAKTDIAFSPNVVAGSQLSYEPFRHLSLALLSKYVGRQYLDNTSSESRQLNPYFTNDLRVSYAWHPGVVKEINCSLLINNVFDITYESNGYTYSYRFSGQRVTENFYFPQAGRNFLLAVGVKF